MEKGHLNRKIIFYLRIALLGYMRHFFILFTYWFILLQNGETCLSWGLTETALKLSHPHSHNFQNRGNKGNRQGQHSSVDLYAGKYKVCDHLSAAKLKTHSAIDLAWIILHIPTGISGHDATQCTQNFHPRTSLLTFTHLSPFLHEALPSAGIYNT